MARTMLSRDDASLRLFDHGEGPAIIFQHGLGGDEAQAVETFSPTVGCRRLTLECRGHGGSDLGSSRPFSFAMFADDVLAAADGAGVGRFVAGGVSMGAAIALRLACRLPDRVVGLIVVRPAWLFSAAPANMRPIAEVADLIKAHGPAQAKSDFAASETAARLSAEAPDNLKSLLGYFDRPDAQHFAQVLADIAADGPGVSEPDAAVLAVPALVIGNDLDAIHPLSIAQDLAATIPGATVRQVSPKSVDKARHLGDVHAAIAAFLETRLSIRNGASS